MATEPSTYRPGVSGRPVTLDGGLELLILGRFGAAALDERIDDVMLGRELPLLDVLFPPMRADLPMTI